LSDAKPGAIADLTPAPGFASLNPGYTNSGIRIPSPPP